MTHASEAHAAAAEKVAIINQILKQKQKVLDLETGDDSAEIELVYSKYVSPEYDSAKFSPLTEDEFNAVLLEKAGELISPISNQISAFLAKAQSDGYQAAKQTALSKGNYLTADLKAKIVQVMRGNQAFVELTAADCYKRWRDGYTAKKPGAFKVLETAKALGDFGDDL